MWDNIELIETVNVQAFFANISEKDAESPVGGGWK